TPGSAGLAEFLSAAVMQIYVGPSELPLYALIWRFINSYATVITGSLLFWHWLRSGLVGREEAVNIAYSVSPCAVTPSGLTSASQLALVELGGKRYTIPVAELTRGSDASCGSPLSGAPV